MKVYPNRANVRFTTKREMEGMKRAARILRVSANRFMTDAINEKTASVLASQKSQEVNSAAD